MLNTNGFLTGKQFDFNKGKSAVDAATKLRETVEANNKKYVLIIFLDIENMSNTLWQPKIIDGLKDINCSKNIAKAIKDYFTNRKIQVKLKFGTITRQLNRGCPQGSILVLHL